MRISRFAAFIAAPLGASLMAAFPARADTTLCNDFKVGIFVALANQVGPNYAATGWWRVEPGKCVDTDFAMTTKTFYYAADSDSWRVGRRTGHDHWGKKVGLYVGINDFNYPDAQKKRKGAKLEKFSTSTWDANTDPATVKVVVHFMQDNSSVMMTGNVPGAAVSPKSGAAGGAAQPASQPAAQPSTQAQPQGGGRSAPASVPASAGPNPSKAGGPPSMPGR